MMMPLYVQLPLLVVLFGIGALILGTALTPAIAWFMWASQHISTWTFWTQAWGYGFIGAVAFLIFGFSLMAIAIILTRLMPRLKPGEYAFGSPQGLQWFFSGVLGFLVSKLFLDFLTLTGVNVWYFRMMGAKIGKGVQINTKELSDFHLIEIGDSSMIGGQSTIIAHVGERGKLKLRPVKIGSKVTVGLGSIIFPGVEIGDRAVIGAGSLVLKDEKVPPKSMYVGVPAKNIKTRSNNEPNTESSETTEAESKT